MCVRHSIMSDSFCDPMDYSPPGSSVHAILQARILECVAISFSRDPSQPRIEPGSHRLHYKYSSLIPTKSLMFKIKSGVFPGGIVDRNPPANAGDSGSIHDPRRFYKPSSNGTHVPQLLSLHSRACKLQILSLHALEPVFLKKRNNLNEKPVYLNEEKALMQEWRTSASTK